MGCRCGSGLTLHSLDTPLNKAFVALNVLEMFLKVKEYLWLEYRQFKVIDSPSACMLLRHKRLTNQNVTLIISHHGYIANSHIPFLSMGPSKMGRATQSQGHETPLLSYLQISCKSKSIVWRIFLPHLQMWIWCHWHQVSYPSFSRMWATMMFTIKRRVESFKLPVSSYSLITVMPAGLEVRIFSTA